MINPIQEELIDTVYKNHYSKSPSDHYSKSPSDFFNYICITKNTGSHGRFWDGMKRLINFKASGTTETTMQTLEEIRQGLLDVGEVIPGKHIICAILYSLGNDYQLLRSNIFDLDTDKLDINEVYRMTFKFDGDHHNATSNTTMRINAITTQPDPKDVKDKRQPREITCPLCKEVGHSIYGCQKFNCRQCGSKDHIGKKCPADRSTLTCSKGDNKPGHNDEACIE
ncbi:hypothetical protein SARC_07329 [Sphaeroforma arctica JP610]|uniref:CCHC-type domain-containing protein n=1 Tax=Sphaeroforma arctica JP610 TaxID=667725 RepID=A0A0L0FUS4_9EUKA|nr:hypothetical protein SARC_07329 [Sphaeroforma arctica JP610]KNC80316.1 hypothetical protein SARC_07329 [Sphaeroforma arctica JP610]|eukprot:XP_014154218.1 hypothetical protein SARC_07329 [Sphaeroforma arctica JP610]